MSTATETTPLSRQSSAGGGERDNHKEYDVKPFGPQVR